MRLLVAGVILPDPLEKWLADFRKDLNPEKEVIIWEIYADVFQKHTKRDHPKGLKNEVLGVLLTFSPYFPDLVFMNRRKHLTQKMVTAICMDIGKGIIERFGNGTSKK